MSDMAAVILAAGKGTRMASNRPKILHEVGGKPMVVHVVEAARQVTTRPPLLVIAPDDGTIPHLFGAHCDYVVQPEALGTGHAAQVALPHLADCTQVLLTYADMPLLRVETYARLLQLQRETGAAVALLSVWGEASSSFGRVVRTVEGGVCEIVEVAEAHRRPESEALLAIQELNVGVYAFSAEFLAAALPRLPLRQARTGPEYYLTDTVSLALEQGENVVALLLDDPEEGLGAGTRAELAQVERAFRRRTARYWLAHGVTLIDPDAVYIDPDVVIGQDTVIWPNSYVQGNTQIGPDCVVGPNTIVRGARIGRNCRLEQVIIEQVTLPDGSAPPPFTHLTSLP